MNLLQSMAQLVIDSAAHFKFGEREAEHVSKMTLDRVAPSGWLVQFPKGTVFIEDEVLMRINLANGYKCVPLFAGEEL